MGPLDTKGLNEALRFGVLLLISGGVAIGLAIAFVVIPLISWLCHHVKVASPDSPDGSHVTLRNQGAYQGLWVEEPRCVMAIVTKSPAIPRGYEETLPFVVVYIKREDGTLPEFPYALNFQNGDFNLQIPGNDDRELQVVPMSKVIKLIEADTDARKSKHWQWMPRALPHDPQA